MSKHKPSALTPAQRSQATTLLRQSYGISIVAQQTNAHPDDIRALRTELKLNPHTK